MDSALGAQLSVLAGGLLSLLALLLMRRLAGAGGPYGQGPWPGLTLRGAGVLLADALLLAGSQLLLGRAEGDAGARGALPYVPLAAAGSVAALALAARVTALPGAAAAACGAYLLPRSLASLLSPALAPPPLLIVPAVALDLGLWVRATDLANVAELWPRRGRAALRRAWRKRPRRPRTVSRRRAALAGALAGALLAALEPPYAQLLGSDPGGWTTGATTLGAALAALGGGLAAWCVRAARPP